MKKYIIPLTLFLFLLPGCVMLLVSAYAQEAVTGFFPDVPGRWEQSINLSYAADYGISAEDSRLLGKKLESLAAIVSQAGVFNPPLGFMPRLGARFLPPSICPQKECPRWPAAAEATVMIYYFIGRHANGEYRWGGEANTSANISLNYLGRTLWYTRHEQYQMPDGRYIFYTPQKTAEVAGFPLYDNSALILTRGARPYWVPVTCEQFLIAAIRFYEAALAKSKESLDRIPSDLYQEWIQGKEERRRVREQSYAAVKKMDPAKAEQFRKLSEDMEAGMEAKMKAMAPDVARIKADDDSHDRKMIDSLRKELAGMSSAKRNSQAWRGRIDEKEFLSRGGFHSELVPAGTADAGPLVAINPDFFDKSLPRSAIQVITVDLAPGGHSETFIGVQRLREMLATTDWNKVAGLLE